MFGCLCSLFSFAEHVAFLFFFIVLIDGWTRDGLKGAFTSLISLLKQCVATRAIIEGVLRGQVKQFTTQIKSLGRKEGAPRIRTLPKEGWSSEKLLEEMNRLRASYKHPDESRLFAYVYTGEDETFELQKKAMTLFKEKSGLSEEHDNILDTFYKGFMHENALSPMAFPALRQFENDIVSMTAAMLHGDSDVVGSVTSGGTESLLMAIKTYRDRARDLYPQISRPEMVAPITIHPGHEKAAHYFDVKIVHVPVNEDGLPDIKQYEAAITPNTIALLCSAPQYCHGIIDPVQAISDIACKRGLPLHVDACFGGFMLPWVEKLGYPVPPFDFRLPGVTSMSADIHKYGFGCKGSSVILYREDSIRKYQFFAYSQWPGGLFGSPTMAGTRPGGNMAAAWCTLMHMGESGYIETARKLMQTTEAMKEGIGNINGLAVIGKPQMTAFAVRSADPQIGILQMADLMEKKGWTLERQQKPDSIHFSIMPHHENCVTQLVSDFDECVRQLRATSSGVGQGSAGMYGMMAKVPNTIIEDFILEFFNQVYKS